MIRSLLHLVLAVVTAFAVVRVLMPQAARESLADLRLRQAQWLSVIVGVAAGYLLLLCIQAANIGGVPNPFGVIPFLILTTTLAAAVPLLRGAWLRARHARASGHAEACRAADVPRVDGADHSPTRHRGLSGQEEPPIRW